MYARMAQFEGDPASVDQLVAEIKTANVIFCETEDDLKKAHEALNQMSPDSDTRRTSVELYEVAIDGRMS